MGERDLNLITSRATESMFSAANVEQYPLGSFFFYCLPKSAIKAIIQWSKSRNPHHKIQNLRSLPMKTKRQGRFWQHTQGQLILVLLVLLVPTLLTQAQVFYEWYKSRQESELLANLQIARAVAKTFDRFVEDVLHKQYAIGLALTGSKLEDQRRYIEENRAEYPMFLNLIWISPEGVILVSHFPEVEGQSISDRKYFQDIIGGRDWAVGDLMIGKATGETSIAIARAIRNKQGQLLGVVASSILPDRLDDVLAIHRPKGGGHALVDSRGMLVYRYPPYDITWEQRNWLKNYPEFREALSGKEVAKPVFSSHERKNRLVAFVPIPSIGWAASAGRTEELVMAPVVSQLLPQAGFLLVISIAAFGAAVFCSRFIVKSVERLRNHAIALGSGDTQDPAVASGPVEIKELASSFNEMADKLRSRETIVRNQREWLTVTLNSIGDGVLTTDTEGKITFLNPVVAALTGWGPEEATGQPVGSVFRIINEKTRLPAEDVVERVLHEGCTVALANHTALVTPDGREIPIEDSAAPIRDDEGKVSGVVLVFHDVTERRRVRDALHDSEERLRLFIGHAPASLAMFDREMRYISASRRWHTDYGLEKTDLTGLSHYEIFPEISEYWKEIHRRGLAGEVVRADAERFDRADGSAQWIRWEVRPWYDAPGTVGGIVIFSEDITERQQLLEKIESVARFPDENPNPVLRVSNEGELIYANRSSANLLESLGWNPGETLSGDWRQHALQTLSSGCPKEMELTCEGVVYSLLLTPVRDLGYINIYGRDITERKLMEMEREVTVELLKIVNQSTGMAGMVEAAATFFQHKSGCEAVGIRLNEEEDFPYFEPHGFPEEFVRMENSLCARNAFGDIIRYSHGSPVIECMCGNVILGRVDPSKPFFTPGGSFWANSTTRLLATTTDEDRQTRTRNRCNGEGYESVALIPLRLGAECSGLIQLNDRRKGMFSAETIAVWERLADYLAVAVAKYRADEALRVNQSRLDLALLSAHMGVWRLDLIEEKRIFDDQVCHLLGIDPTKFTGTAEEFHNAVHPEDRETLKAALARTIEQDVPYEEEYRALWPDGSVHYIAARGKLVRDDNGQPVRVNGLIWDITERKQMEEELRKSRDELELRVQDRTAELKTYMSKLEESNQALKEFASIASHDLQEPLRKVISFGNMLKQKCGSSLGEQGNGYLDRILNANQRMQSLLTALLEYSRLSTRTDPFVTVELTQIIHEVLCDLEVRIEKTGGEVHVEDLPVIVADPTQMRQLFQNLVGNALKFHKDGEKPVVSVKKSSTDDGYVQIVILDNGIGFEEQYLERIFAPFQRLHARSEYEGTGMGLAICKKIVERHGGSITARSIPGEGSTFTLCLPSKQTRLENEGDGNHQ